MWHQNRTSINATHIGELEYAVWNRMRSNAFVTTVNAHDPSGSYRCTTHGLQSATVFSRTQNWSSFLVNASLLYWGLIARRSELRRAESYNDCNATGAYLLAPINGTNAYLLVVQQATGLATCPFSYAPSCVGAC
jgi:hypothetical protein